MMLRDNTMHGTMIHPPRRKACFGRTMLSVFTLLVCLSERLKVSGWSQIHFIKNGRSRKNPFSNTLLGSSLLRGSSSNVVLGTSPSSSNRMPEFFEDPSVNMKQSNNTAATQVSNLHTENMLLKDSIRKLEEENERLKQFVEERQKQDMANQKIVIETFEGEHLFDSFDEVSQSSSLKDSKDNDEELWCDVLDGNECPVEPSVSFGQALRDRAYWLVGLLIMQSLSGIILSRNELLLANHPVIIYYLTMMVGAGGNAGNQASVRVIRGIALGTLNERTRGQFLLRELKMAATLSVILSAAGFCRTIFFKTPFPEAITVTAALCMIVFSSICLGAILPLILERIGVDPAHSSTTIQVIMDILGVLLAVLVSGAILDGPLGAFLLPKLGFLN